jgi:CRP/FNR family transcriptional regulator, cyclic AMP receptor protein
MTGTGEARELAEAALRCGGEPLEALLRYGRLERTRAGKAFFYQGDKAEAAFLVLEGNARLVKYRSNGRPMDLPAIERGDWLGLSELVLGVAHPYDALAETACAALAFSRYSFALASALPAFASILARALARESMALQAYLADEGPEEKIVSYLLSRRKELAGIGNARISVTQERLARAIGATRETVNKRLSSLEAMGLVRTLRGQIEVLDWAGLAARKEEA